MNIIRPLQTGFNSQIIEQDSRFYFVSSVYMGIDLDKDMPMLDLYFLKDIFESLGEDFMPDMGMPKPFGEFIVTGSFYSEKPIKAGEVKVEIGDKKKSLYIFGKRKWKGLIPSEPEEFNFLKLNYKSSFGGKNYPYNPDGMGMMDGLLPRIEDKNNLVSSKSEKKKPAGFGPLPVTHPDKKKYMGTYGHDYREKYFPGYPEDMSWKFFMTTDEDQWIEGFFKGDENYSIFNMHPEKKELKGKLPCFRPRLFMKIKEDFLEQNLNLDTIWFFPDKMIALTIFRNVVEVKDDEALEISDIMLSYESENETRGIDYYRACFEKRKKAEDPLSNYLTTHDLIPENHKSPIEILFSKAVEKKETGEMSKNLTKKFDTLKKNAEEELEKAVKDTEKNLNSQNIPEDILNKIKESNKDVAIDENGNFNLRSLINKKQDIKDPDLELMNKNLENILPGITSGDPSSIKMREFSFDKIDQIMDEVQNFSIKKEKYAKEIAEKEIEGMKKDLLQQLSKIDAQTIQKNNMEKIKESLKELENIDLDNNKKPPLPRMDAKEIESKISTISPDIINAMEHLNALKSSGVENHYTESMEKEIREVVEKNIEDAKKAVFEAESNFREAYRETAHFMGECESPHKKDLDSVKKEFLKAFKNNEDLRNRDFSCIDLENEILDGIDLEGAYLEQVNFKNASLKNANLKGAILSRSKMHSCNLSQANLDDANIGGVDAENADFSYVSMKNAKLSKGSFNSSSFDNADMEGIETLETGFKRCSFKNTNIPGLTLMKADISELTFINSNLESSVFMECRVSDSTFENCKMKSTAFIQTDLACIKFNFSDLSSSCFVAKDYESLKNQDLSFKGANIKSCNFQNLKMEGSIFEGCHADGSNFMGCNLKNSNFEGSSCIGAIFKNADLKNIRFVNSNIMKSSFAKANLVNGDFSHSNLYASDFLRSIITNTNFSHANLDLTLIEHWRPK